MPLPILFIGIAAATGGLGIGKTVKAGIDANAAKNINKSAQELVDESSKALDEHRKACGKSLEQLGAEKILF